MASSSPVKKGEKSKWALPKSSTIAYHFGSSGFAVAMATSATHPLDVLKVRLQMQLVGQKGPLTGMGQIFTQMLRNEGVGSLYLGLTPALIRVFLLSSMVFLQVRLQMNSGSKYGAIREMRKIASEEGIAALWKGVGPAMARAASLTASQLATYDESKQAMLMWTPLEEGFPLHLISSAVAGVVSTLVTAPMDMVKTRLMLQRESSTSGNYKNGFHCAYKVMITEGPRALYKGGFTIFARLGPQTAITFVLCEKLRKLTGLHAI